MVMGRAIEILGGTIEIVHTCALIPRVSHLL